MGAALKTLPNSFWFRIEQKSIRGTPDRLGLVRGVFVAIETKKSADDPPSPLQEWMLEQVAEAGGIAIVAYPENWDEVWEYLNNLATGEDEIAPDGTIFN